MTKAVDNTSNQKSFGAELAALGTVLKALSSLGDDAKAFVYRTAGERLGIVTTTGRSSNPPPVQPGGQRNGTPSAMSLDGVGPKDFLKSKKPLTELQRITCLAYYLTNARQSTHFKTADLTALNTEAAGGKLANASATVNNATNQSHLFAPAGKGGLKQITLLGEDYVAALPDQEAAKAAVASHRQPRRKAAKKRKEKKE